MPKWKPSKRLQPDFFLGAFSPFPQQVSSWSLQTLTLLIIRIAHEFWLIGYVALERPENRTRMECSSGSNNCNGNNSNSRRQQQQRQRQQWQQQHSGDFYSLAAALNTLVSSLFTACPEYFFMNFEDFLSLCGTAIKRILKAAEDRLSLYPKRQCQLSYFLV